MRECPRCGEGMVRSGKRDSCKNCGTQTPADGRQIAGVNGLCDYLREHFVDFDIQFNNDIYPITVRIRQ